MMQENGAIAEQSGGLLLRGAGSQRGNTASFGHFPQISRPGFDVIYKKFNIS